MKKFKKIYIEITNICNLACDFCPKTSRKGEFMKDELFEKILQEINGYTKYIYFHLMGEPLLHPRLSHFLDLSDKYGYKVNITTNGTLIDGVSGMLLQKRALRQVNLSLHSFEANTGEYTMDQYLDPIISFVQKADKESDLLICLRLWNLSTEGTRETNRYVLEKIQKGLSLDFELEEKLTPCNGLKLGRNIFINQSLSFKWPNTGDADEGGNAFCLGLRDQAGIHVDGTVVPCCLDNEGIIKLGNINELSFVQILQGDRAQQLYDGFSCRRAVEPLCRKCSYRKRFDNK